MAGALRYYSDRYYKNVVALTHLDGNNGALPGFYPNLAHSDPNGIAAHATGTLPACSTAQKLFGVTSMQLDKTQGQWITVVDNANMQIGTGDFTIEIAFYTGSPSIVHMLIDFNFANSGGGANGFAIYCHVGQFKFYSAADQIVGGAVATNTWQRIAYSRNSGTGVLYVDGSSVGSWADGQTYNHAEMKVGSDVFPTSDGATGFIEELRLTVGIGRYPANYTVSNREFQNY